MLFIDFLQWWYGRGWMLRVQLLGEHIRGVFNFFSVGTLVKTLGSPWRQNISAARNDQGLQAHVSAFLDNLVSRMVGAVVRLVMLFIAVLSVLVVLVMNMLYIALWPALPLAPAIIILFGTLTT